MAKNRYGKKKGKKASGHHRSKRSAAARKAWRTKVRRYGREKAIAMSFGGKRAHRSKKGRRPRGMSHHRSNVARRLARNPALVLAAIQKKEGTTGLPPTKAELRLARIVAARSGRVPRAVDREAQAKARIDAEIKAKKRAAAAAILAIEHRERAAAEARARIVARERELEQRAARL